jgi:hypothetical protein
MIPEAYDNFIHELSGLTVTKKLLWTKIDTDVYILKTKDATIEVGKKTSVAILAPGDYMYFRYTNIGSGKTTDFEVRFNEPGYQKMTALFHNIEFAANNIKDELDNFLKNIK